MWLKVYIFTHIIVVVLIATKKIGIAFRLSLIFYKFQAVSLANIELAIAYLSARLSSYFLIV